MAPAVRTGGTMKTTLLLLYALFSGGAPVRAAGPQPIQQSPPIKVTNVFGPEEVRDWISILGCETNYYNQDQKRCFDPYNASFWSLFEDIQSSGLGLDQKSPMQNCMDLASLTTKMQALSGRIARLRDRLAIPGDVGKIRFTLTTFADPQFGSLWNNGLSDMTTDYCVQGSEHLYDVNLLKQRYVAMMKTNAARIQGQADALNAQLKIELPYDKWDNGKLILDVDAVEKSFKH